MAEDLVPAIAQEREPPELLIEESGVARGALVQLRRGDRRGLVEEGPLRGLLLEPFLDGIELFARRRNEVLRAADVRRKLVTAEVILAHGLHELPLGRRGADHLAGEVQCLVDGRALLGLHGGPELDPFLVLFPEVLRALGLRLRFGALRGLASLHGRLEPADRPRACPLHPGRLGVALRFRQDGLGRANGHVSGADRLAQERPLPQCTRKPRHLLRRAGGDAELFAGVVADAGVAELEVSRAAAQRFESLAEGDIERPAPSRDADEERIDDPREILAGGVVALARERPLEDGSGFREGVEVAGGSCVAEVRSHEMTVAAPSDIRSRAANATLRVEDRSRVSPHTALARIRPELRAT